MSYSSFIARRYLQAKERTGFLSFITGIAIIGVMLGTASLIIALAVLGGFEKEITEKVIGFTAHVEILGFHNQALRDYTTTSTLIERSSPLIIGVQPFVAREAMIRSKETVDGILLKGMEQQKDFTGIRKYIVEGSFDIEGERERLAKIVIGRKLAKKLAVNVGDKVAVFASGRGGELGQMRVTQFRISGIYESGMAEYDDVYGFTSLTAAQRLFQFGETGVSGYEILLSRPDSADVIAERVQDLLGYPYYGRTVFQNYRNLFSWIELQKKPVPIILSLISIVATVNIIGTLLMMVLGKTKQIGILVSLGASRWGITKIFLRQGFTVALIGTVAGNSLALLLCWLQLQFKLIALPSDIYFMSSVPILLRPEYFLIVSSLTMALSMLSALIPARLASKLNPVTAIRFA